MKNILFSIIITIIFSNNVFSQCANLSVLGLLDYNNVEAKFPNAGLLFGDYAYNASSVYFPKNSSIPSIYLSSYWLSGLDTLGNLKGTFNMYPTTTEADIYAGPISSDNSWKANCNFWARPYRMDKTDINIFHLSNGTSISTQMKYWPAKGNPYVQAMGITIFEDAAPFVDVNNDGIYNPIDGDYPRIKGDVCFFSIENDDSTHKYSNSLPMRIETHKLLYVCTGIDMVDNSVFYDLKIINKSKETYKDCIFSLYVDADLGCYSNDMFGCDSAQNMAYFYDSNYDQDNCITGMNGNKNQHSILGIKMLRTPFLNGNQVGMTSMLGMKNGSPGPFSNPTTPAEFRNTQLGKTRTGVAQIYNGRDILYPYNGNPANSNEWSMCNPSSLPADDQRILMNSKFDKLESGSSISLSFAFFHVRPTNGVGLCPDRVTHLNPYSNYLQNTFDKNMLCQSSTLGMENENIRLNEVVVFPNPTNTNMFTVLTKNSEEKEISLINSLGQQVLLKKTNLPTVSISTESLPRGIYFVKISIGKSDTIQKLVIQ